MFPSRRILKIPFVIVMAGLFAVVSAANAGIFSLPRGGTATVLHGMAGQPGVLKMTFNEPYVFRVVKTGDKRAKPGELHDIVLVLANETSRGVQTEYMQRTWRSIDLYNETNRVRGNTAYLKSHKNDTIRALPQRGVTGPLFINVLPNQRVMISVLARELDCTKKRVCNRGDSSKYLIEVQVPNFAASDPLNTCNAGRANRWDVVNINGTYTFGGGSVSQSGDLRIVPIDGSICFTR
jgi:hypothetical protein